MSRLALKPLTIPQGVNVKVENDVISLSFKNQTFSHPLMDVNLNLDNNLISFNFDQTTKCSVGTLRANLKNILTGLTDGFQKKLMLVGVGYKAAVQGSTLVLNVGYSHPINYDIPAGITITTPSPTEIVVAGSDKQSVGLVASIIRSYREPELYKGKGIRYADEVIELKETKKK